MFKRILSLLLIAALCFCVPALAENTEEETKESFRSLPGYTCFPLSADSNEEYPGHFCIDCPIEWDGGENSEVYGLPSVIAMDPENQNHLILAVEISLSDQALIMVDENNPTYSFLWEGLYVTQGISTNESKIVEQFDLHGFPATRVEMVGQGFEMVWIMDPYDGISLDDEIKVMGDLWFFMYTTDPDDAEYTNTISEMVDSFTTCGVFSFGPMSLDIAPASDFAYKIEQDEVCLTAYVGKSDYVVVPAEIEGKPVTSMNSCVFYETGVRYVALPDTVREMGSSTFGGCTHLIYARMPDSLEVLPSATFESCFRLANPGLNEGLKKIEYAAFWGNYYLNALQLPKSLEQIDDNAFVMCDYLAYINAPEENTHFRSNEDNTILMSADGTKLIFYSFMNEAKEYQVPDGVKMIYANSFNRAPLTGITLPDGLEYIGYNAFGRTGIKELHVPASVTAIGIMDNVSMEDNPELQTGAYVSLGNSLQTICGAAGSAAEKYAEIHKLTFVPEE
ncbi:leucine-rich repeat domain-containing protein [Aristaeella lactis]|uniref:Leucine rich repeat-containing protein n=1 Tax=Aristaeella lactis TaxID=3046383 RepID=A0AC61PKT8_9FIRM|nr:leucine-rich repeat domain-containing protein [Aristaeella lactis]QUA52069.1 leucine-rich repeat domain-containing protein [Aristaeella lactis]SMC57452.1 Leucine rich repeat-containing protein [Aristaeella lactis]